MCFENCMHWLIPILKMLNFTEKNYHQRSSRIAFTWVFAAFSISGANHFRPYSNLEKCRKKLFELREKFREFSKALIATKFNHIIALNALTMMPIFTLLVIDLSFFKNNIFSFTKKNKEIAPQCLDYDANFHTCHW